MVALDGTKIRAVASPKNIAGAERLARDIAHTEGEIAYYLDRLDVMDERRAIAGEMDGMGGITSDRSSRETAHGDNRMGLGLQGRGPLRKRHP